MWENNGHCNTLITLIQPQTRTSFQIKAVEADQGCPQVVLYSAEGLLFHRKELISDHRTAPQISL